MLPLPFANVRVYHVIITLSKGVDFDATSSIGAVVGIYRKIITPSTLVKHQSLFSSAFAGSDIFSM